MNDSYDRELAENFLTFMLDYYAMIRRHIVEKNEIRFHSHGFYLLNILESNKDELLTMSACAKQMNITKQQLTKLVNDLEAMGLVKRIHDERNRRQVYVTLTDDGRNEFEEIKQAMLECTVAGLKDFSEDELEQLGDCLERLIPLLEKFRGNC